MGRGVGDGLDVTDVGTTRGADGALQPPTVRQSAASAGSHAVLGHPAILIAEKLTGGGSCRGGALCASRRSCHAVAMNDVVRAELVATVQQVMVAPGQHVAAGQPIAMLESMKMEIPVLAEGAGTVREIGVGAGDVVQEGDVIAVIGD